MQIKTFVGVAVAVATVAMPAHAALEFIGQQDMQGTGLGAVDTVLTLQANGSASFEAGSVGRSVGMADDVISGDAKTGASQTLTRTLGSIGAASASDLRVVFNAVEPGNTAGQGITINDLTLNLYSPTGALVFSSSPFQSTTFAETFSGVGNTGFMFALDSADAARAQAALGGAGFASYRVGLSASLSGAAGGPETFSISSVTPVPEPGTLAMMLAGFGVAGLLVRRRR